MERLSSVGIVLSILPPIRAVSRGMMLNFSSSLFEGKGTDDESWGLDNVRVSSNSDAPITASAAAPSVGLAAQAFGSIYGLLRTQQCLSYGGGWLLAGWSPLPLCTPYT